MMGDPFRPTDGLCSLMHTWIPQIVFDTKSCRRQRPNGITSHYATINLR